jgi:hypothetical protein
MKKLLLAFTLLFSVTSFSQFTPVILEHDFLYQAYPNKLLINHSCFDSIQVKKGDLLLPKATVNVNGVDRVGYIVYTSFSMPVKIVVSGYTNGQIASVDTTYYKIKPLPNEIILNPSISKTTGAQLQVSLPPACAHLSCTYTILSGEIGSKDSMPFSGNTITPNIISTLKPGKKVAVTLVVRNNSNNHMNLIEGLLEIVP